MTSIKYNELVEWIELLQERVCTLEMKNALETDNEYLKKAIKLIKERSIISVSTSLFQKELRIGFNQAYRIIDLLRDKGYLIPEDKGKLVQRVKRSRLSNWLLRTKKR
jgi:DNA segregation ATPase FtsK/SpoIIIE-like protein